MKTPDIWHSARGFWGGLFLAYLTGLIGEALSVESTGYPRTLFLIIALPGSAVMASCSTVIFLAWWWFRHRRTQRYQRLSWATTMATGAICVLVVLGVTQLIYGGGQHHDSMIDLGWLVFFFVMPAVCAEALYRIEKRSPAAGRTMPDDKAGA